MRDDGDLITTALELVGLLLIVAGVAVAVARLNLPCGLAVAGSGLLGVSALLTFLGSRKSRPAEDVA